ncbi:MAG: RNase adapter RapZ [Pseudomonadota bacterium]
MPSDVARDEETDTGRKGEGGRETSGEERAPPPDWRSHLVIVTGRSGAGRTTAMAVLEDLGFDRVDGAPLKLIPSILRELIVAERGRVAIGVDARTAGFSNEGFAALKRDLAALDVARVTALFLDGSDEALRRRYTETRRRHPLAPHGAMEEGIALDRALTAPIKEQADLVIDTTTLTPNELRRTIVDRVAPASLLGMTIEIVSFAYRNGLPPEADLVFDCRFLRNPHYDPALRPRDGRDPDVAAYVKEDPLFQPFFDQVLAHLTLLKPAYEASGKSYLTIAFGCTGGKHRSVALAEAMGAAMQDRRSAVRVRHRERERAEAETLHAATDATGAALTPPAAATRADGSAPGESR